MTNQNKLKVKKETVSSEQTKRILNDSSPFSVTEAYKSLRTNIMFSMPASTGSKVILLTSAAPGEGKTTTSANLAITFSQIGAKVILIDADLRASRLIRYMNLPHSEGLSNLLCGFSTFEKVVIRDARPNLDVLCAGKTPPNPTELLESPSFSALVEGLRERYDYIIIDTPPIATITDAAIITKNCDGAIMIIHENVTDYDRLDVAINALRRTGVRILGLINVGVQTAGKKYGYSYYHHYYSSSSASSEDGKE